MVLCINKQGLLQAIQKRFKTHIEISEIIATVQKIIFQSEVDENTSMDNNLDWDSMNHMLIISAIEDRFNLKLTPSEITKATSIKNINDIISYNLFQ